MFLRIMKGLGTSVRVAVLRCYDGTTRYTDAVALADGRVLVVPRADLSTAKALLAAHKVAARRAAAGIVAPEPQCLLENAV